MGGVQVSSIGSHCRLVELFKMLNHWQPEPVLVVPPTLPPPSDLAVGELVTLPPYHTWYMPESPADPPHHHLKQACILCHEVEEA